jgi:hypothetical protein
VSDVITRELLEKAEAMFSEQNISPRGFYPFVVRCTPKQAGEIAEQFGVDTSFETGSLLVVGNYLLVVE